MQGFDFKGSVAVITGGGGDIGRGIGLIFAQAGANIALLDADLEAVLKAAQIIEDHCGVKAKGYQLDIANEKEVYSVFQQVHDDFGQIDMLVANADPSIPGEGPTLYDSPSLAAQQIMSVNVLGNGYCIKAALDYMLPRKQGKIVTVASIAGRIGTPNGANHAASMAALISITQSVAMAHAREGINCNCICPGYIRANLWKELEPDTARRMGLTVEQMWQQAALDNIAQGVEQAPEDIGNAAAFLCSDWAQHITGQTLNVDGGSRFN
ncbi:MAG: SDR family NAD(P)-dependent oxidoreductase [Syntrophomonadaceae bacterium]|jgi:NAD(P)-dependent dehydrogenase (short-subunit alcohol dehydrogenase family)